MSKRNSTRTVNSRRSAPRKASRSISTDQACRGVLELHAKGYGFLRQIDNGLSRQDSDVFVSQSLIQRFDLRQGAEIVGQVQSASPAKGCRLAVIDSINGRCVDAHVRRLEFDELTPVNPRNWLRLETKGGPLSTRVIDLLVPIGLGQRALIASPPRAGKTTLLTQIGQSITANYPEVRLVVLLIDERPEEVTDIQMELDAEVYASCLDHDVANHIRLSNLVVDRCKQLAEAGTDVFLIIDSLTRMTRAFNKSPRLTGAIGAGGLNIRALDGPKRIFSSARNFAQGGSLTIVASLLTETENRMDEVIFREFQGTGNMDLVLSKKIADQRIWPAIDIENSATRRVELLHDSDTYAAVSALQRTLTKMRPSEAISELTNKLSRFETNEEFVRLINRKLNRVSSELIEDVESAKSRQTNFADRPKT